MADIWWSDPVSGIPVGGDEEVVIVPEGVKMLTQKQVDHYIAKTEAERVARGQAVRDANADKAKNVHAEAKAGGFSADLAVALAKQLDPTFEVKA